jgi:hypothetical protein
MYVGVLSACRDRSAIGHRLPEESPSGLTVHESDLEMRLPIWPGRSVIVE